MPLLSPIESYANDEDLIVFENIRFGLSSTIRKDFRNR